MKKCFTLLSFFILNFYFSQQVEELRIITEKYAPEFERLETKYKNIQIKKLSGKELEDLNLKKNSEINTLEFKRNEEYLVQLPKIKSEKPISIDQKIAQHTDETNEVSPVYPGGINAFRQETANNFYAGTIDANGKISSEIVFVIERDGTIVDVKATGSNDNFNRQAELAVYLAKYKWEAARIDGHPVRYRFHIPLNLNFD